MRLWVMMVSAVALLASTPLRAAAQDWVIPAGQEEAIQAFLQPVGFDQPVAEGWILQTISVERVRVDLLFVNVADQAVEPAKLALVHPDSGVKGMKMGPVIVVGDAPEPIQAAMKEALSSKKMSDLFWERPASSRRSPDGLREDGGTDRPRTSLALSRNRVLLGLLAAAVLAFLVWLEVRERRRKKLTGDGDAEPSEAAPPFDT